MSAILTVPYPEAANAISRKHPLMPTTDAELRWLCMMASESCGNILEIGTHFGLTARCIAVHCPNKLVFTVDYIAEKPTMLPQQVHEMPTLDTIGVWVRGLPNVFISLQDSKTFDYTGKDIGFVFIDGDHSTEGVNADSALALANARSRAERGMRTTIVWHDYYDHPWVKVKEYLNVLAQSVPIRLVADTHIAFATL